MPQFDVPANQIRTKTIEASDIDILDRLVNKWLETHSETILGSDLSIAFGTFRLKYARTLYFRAPPVVAQPTPTSAPDAAEPTPKPPVNKGGCILDSSGKQTGKVKWFNSIKGYGFVTPDSGARDIFLHISAVERAGFSTLEEGTRIRFKIVSTRGKQSVEEIELIK